MTRRNNITIGIFFLTFLASLYSLKNDDESSAIIGLDGSSIIQFEAFTNIVEVNQEQAAVKSDGYELWFSDNGGKTFKPVGTSVDLSQFRNPNLKNYITSLKFKPTISNGPEIKCCVLKATNYKRGKETLPFYFTATQQFSTQLPIVSIQTNEDHLFHPVKGIMQFGEESWYNSSFKTPWYELPANFRRRGKKSAIKVNYQYIIGDSLKYERELMLRISGNATRSYPQKSLRLEVQQSDVIAKDSFNFWSDKKIWWESFVLRNSGNDNTKTLFADLFMHNLAKECKVIRQKGKPVHVFLNGNYWGIYNLRERISQRKIAEEENVSPNEVTILENGNVELKDGDTLVQQNFLETVNNYIDKSISYKDLKEEISIKSLADYFFLETFYANRDWPQNNMMWYKAGDKKWQWILNDLDFALNYLGEDNLQTNMFNILGNYNSNICVNLFNTLLTREEEFKLFFIERTQKHLEESFIPEKIEENYNHLKGNLTDEISYHLDRWRAIGSIESWENNCLNLKLFLLNRVEIYNEQLERL